VDTEEAEDQLGEVEKADASGGGDDSEAELLGDLDDSVE